jgi:hypothetical protein
MLVRPLSREVRLLGTIALVVAVVPSMLDRAESLWGSSTPLSFMVSRMVLDGETERGEENAELRMAADGLVSTLIEAALVATEAGRWVVSGLAI